MRQWKMLDGMCLALVYYFFWKTSEQVNKALRLFNGELFIPTEVVRTKSCLGVNLRLQN